MPEFDIDSLKSTWQKQEVTPKYETGEILSMLNQKSRNYVKYILWISIAEFLLFVAVNAYYISQNEESSGFLKIMEQLGVEKNPEIMSTFSSLYMILKIASLLVTAYFVIVFYINYRKINVESDLKLFILQIMRFKRTVNHFIIANITMLIVFTAVISLFVLKTFSDQHIEMDNPTFIGFITGMILTTLLSAGLIWLYYRIVYGTIIRRLGKNLRQLQEIEQTK